MSTNNCNDLILQSEITCTSWVLRVVCLKYSSNKFVAYVLVFLVGLSFKAVKPLISLFSGWFH